MTPLPILYIMTLTYILKVTIFEIVNISKTARANEKCPSMTFIKVYICHRMEPLQMMYYVILT